MPSIITTDFRIDNAEHFKESFSTDNTYMFIGRVRTWDAPNDDNNPPIPVDNTENQFDWWRESISYKQIQPTDVSLAVPRYDWDIAGTTVYDQYDSSVDDLFTTKVPFVITDQFNVYKCIFNNNGGFSTVKPTGTGTSTITTADDYQWKFMFTVSVGDVDKFITPQHVPIHLAEIGDGSDQLLVQQAAVPGEIVTIRVTDGGSGYTTAPVTISGDGTGATATANIGGGIITSVDITAVGSGYTSASISIGGDGTGATAEPNLAPPGGHGSNAPEELGAFFLIINQKFEFDEGGDATTDNDFRLVGMTRNPYNFGTTVVATAPTARQTTQFTVSNEVGNFDHDELITGQTSGATARAVDLATAGEIFVNNVTGTFVVAEQILGDISGATADLDVISDPELEPNSGDVLFIEQRKPISRADDQLEKISITIEW